MGKGWGEEVNVAAFPTLLTMIVAFSGNIVAEEDLKKPERPLFGKPADRPFRVGCPQVPFSKTRLSAKLFYFNENYFLFSCR